MNQPLFSNLRLGPALIKNLKSIGYKEMTPIQSRSLPHILSGKDVIAQAKTGSGKTAAFGLGILQNLKVNKFEVQSLVLCPTRELADQVAKSLRQLGQTIPNIKILTLCGGTPLRPQANSLEHGAHIVVGTPGRIEDHLSKKTLNLKSLTTLVLDEADRMLDMGFQDSLEAIIDQIPEKRQTLLFSATYPDEIKSISKKIMDKPALIQVQMTHDSSSITQTFYRMKDNKQRLTAVRLILHDKQPESTLIFCNTKQETLDVADELSHHGFTALALNGDMDQRAREQILVRFANKSTSVLVATDVAARGLDIDALDAVINFSLAHDPEIHVHRIGRTGRAGSKGNAFTLYSDGEKHKVIKLEEYLDMDVDAEALPPFTLLDNPTFHPRLATIQIDGGKKQKLRPGDILGALTGANGITGKQVGKIHIFDSCAYVAVNQDVSKEALKKLSNENLKGRSFKVRLIRA